MSSSTYYFEDIKVVPTLQLKRLLNDRETSVRTKTEVQEELKRRNK